MKKSEILKNLNERKCDVKSYYREGNILWVYVKYISALDMVYLNKMGFIVFIEGSGDKLLMEINGNIEWD